MLRWLSDDVTASVAIVTAVSLTIPIGDLSFYNSSPLNTRGRLFRLAPAGPPVYDLGFVCEALFVDDPTRTLSGQGRT